MLVTMGEKGEPIGVPNVCLYIALLNLKNTEDDINSIAHINSVLGINVCCSMYCHLLLILSMIRS